MDNIVLKGSGEISEAAIEKIKARYKQKQQELIEELRETIKQEDW